LEEEDVEETGEALTDLEISNVGHVGEGGICLKNVPNPNASYVTKRGI